MKTKLIKTESEYEDALARVEKLMDARPGTSQGDELEVLSLLIHDYEERVFPIAKPDPVAAIRFRMAQQGLTNKNLVPFLGSRSRVSEVLSGRRGLSLKMIRALVSGLRIPADTNRSSPRMGRRSVLRRLSAAPAGAWFVFNGPTHGFIVGYYLARLRR